MIEIIREEEIGGTTERQGLPKDIKQMGKPDIGDRIYVEDEVYQLLHPYNSVDEKRVYVLLGRFENYAGRECVFVEAAIFLEEMAFDGELPLWNDNTWAYIYKQLRREYDNMVIVGWAIDIKGLLPNMTMRLERLHQSYFGGAHQILFLIDSLEREEAFYGNKSGHLYRREGFYIYREKKEAAMCRQTYPANEEQNVRKQQEIWEEQTAPTEYMERENMQQGIYRKQMVKEERRWIPSYASTLLLVVVVCVLGVTAHLNSKKMEAMEATLAQMNLSQTIVAETETPGVKVESVAGNVEKQGEADAASMSETPEVTALEAVSLTEENEGVAQSEKTEIPESGAQEVGETSTAATENSTAATSATATTLTEAQVYLNQGYYIVQQGDSLVGICKKIYQTTAMMDKLCEVNGIENADAIYAGQKLILPN